MSECDLAHRHCIVSIVVVVDRDAPLLEVAFTLATSRRFSSLLHGRKQQRDQDSNDRDDDQ